MLWSALHIYYHSNQDILITEGVAPCLQQSAKSLPYFFLRYWAGGPHLRLRIHSATTEQMEIIQTSIQSWLDKNPSDIKLSLVQIQRMQEWLGRLENVETSKFQVHPSGSLITAEYQQELDKYGLLGIEVAERFFVESSRVVVDTLKSSTDRRWIALSMMVATVYEAFESDYARLDFLRRYQKSWSRYEKEQYFTQKIAELNIIAAHRIIKQVLSSLGSNTPLDRWGATVSALAQKAASMGERSSESYLFHFLHTHNNRIGLSTVDEARLAMLLSSYLTLRTTNRNQ